MPVKFDQSELAISSDSGTFPLVEKFVLTVVLFGARGGLQFEWRGRGLNEVVARDLLAPQHGPLVRWCALDETRLAKDYETL